MPLIKHMRAGNCLAEYPLPPQGTLTIGRLKANDIVISDPAVSARHAEIGYHDGAYFITDTQSKNGTFVNKQLIISHELAPDDVIGIGKDRLQYEMAPNEPSQALASGNDLEGMQQTLYMDTPNHRSRLARGVSDLASQSSAPPPPGRLVYFAGGEGEIVLDQPSYRLGKSAACEISVKGLWLPEVAGTIVRRIDSYYLVPQSERSRLKVNYRKIDQEIKLANFDVIEFGKAKFQFQYPPNTPPSANHGAIPETQSGPQSG